MRLIDKDVLLDLFHIKEPCMECPWFTKGCDKPVYSPMEICERIDDAPTVDAAPVVRCKDCKHSIDYDFSEGQGFCDWSGMIVRENFYCAEGKGREEQKDG